LSLLDPLRSAAKSAIIFAGHMLLALCVALMFRGFEWVWQHLYGCEEPMLVGRLPLRYLFEIGDGLILGLFVFFGFLEALQSFLDDRRDRRD
jgi:hypothetical protein